MASRKRSRLGLLLEVFFDGSLLLIFMAQAFVVSCLFIYGYLPLPAHWGNQWIAGKLPPGIRLEVDTFRLQTNGSITLIGIELHSENIKQPLLQAKCAEVEFQWEGLGQLPQPESLVFSGGTLYSPSVYSPDGQHRRILERIALRIVPGVQNWQMDRFAALHGDIRLRGNLELPGSFDDAAERTDAEAFIHRFYTQVAKLLEQKEPISYFHTPTLAFEWSTDDAQLPKVDLRISSHLFQHPQVSAEEIQLQGSVRLQDGHLTPLSTPRLSAAKLAVPRYDLTAENIRAESSLDGLNRLLKHDWPQIQLAARRIDIRDFTLDAPTLHIKPQVAPKLSFQGTTRSLKGAIELKGQIDTQTHRGQIQARGSIDLVKLASQTIDAKLPHITYNTPPYYDVDLDFEQGFTLKQLAIKAQVNQLHVDDLTFDHINARARYQNGLYEIEELYLRRQKQWLDLKFSLDTNSDDYRVTLIGSAVPYDYNALLPHWWASIFKDFDFSQTDGSLGDFIIYGNTRRGASDLYYGHAQARNVRYQGVAVDQGELIVRGRGPYTELNDLKVRSGQGWARGDISFASRVGDDKGPVSVRLDLETKLTLTKAAKLFQGQAARVIDDFETDALPQAKLAGAIFNQEYPAYAGKSYFDLSVALDHALRFKNVPLDYLRFDLYGRSTVSHLRNVQLGYADGKGTAAVDVFTPPTSASSLRYQFSLKNAKQNQALQNLPQFNPLGSSLQSSKDNETDQSNKFTPRADLELHGQGPSEAPLKHQGFGNFEIRNERLDTIQLLGPLSKLLQNTYFNFTSFNLDQMHGTFRYDKDLINFKSLQIDGPRTHIEAPGSLRLSDQALDMQVEVALFGNAGNPDSNLRKLSDLITKPIPNLLSFELDGTLKEQKLRSLYDPRKFIPHF